MSVQCPMLMLLLNWFMGHCHCPRKFKDLRLETMCVLSFAGLFCAKELLNIRVRDITCSDDDFVINVPESKTDIYRKDPHVFIGRSNAETCPGVLTNRYLAKANILMTVHLFRNLVHLRSVDSFTLGKRVVSYTRFRKNFKECLKELGHNEKLYGLHSFRASGTTTLAKSLTAPNKERLLKPHGRWKTDISKDMYIKEDKVERLMVSKSMGI